MATKKCPFCAEEIQADAIKCRFCGSWLTQPLEQPGVPAPAELPVSPPVVPKVEAPVPANPPQPSTPVQVAVVLGKYRVEIPYQKRFSMPQQCTGCGAPSQGLTREVSKTNLTVGVTSAGTRSFKLNFPVCADCKKASDIATNMGMKGCFPALLAGLAIVAISYFLLQPYIGQKWWWSLAVGGVVWVVLFYIIQHRPGNQPPHKINERYMKLNESVKIVEIDDTGKFFTGKNKHITFEFTREDFASQFASLNDGKLV